MTSSVPPLVQLVNHEPVTFRFNNQFDSVNI